MKALAQETGARSFCPAHIRELVGVYARITEEFSNAYAMGYTSKNPRRDGLVVLERGEGVWVWDIQGRRFSPPLVITTQQIDWIIEHVEDILRQQH